MGPRRGRGASSKQGARVRVGRAAARQRSRGQSRAPETFSGHTCGGATLGSGARTTSLTPTGAVCRFAETDVGGDSSTGTAAGGGSDWKKAGGVTVTKALGDDGLAAATAALGDDGWAALGEGGLAVVPAFGEERLVTAFGDDGLPAAPAPGVPGISSGEVRLPCRLRRRAWRRWRRCSARGDSAGSSCGSGIGGRGAGPDGAVARRDSLNGVLRRASGVDTRASMACSVAMTSVRMAESRAASSPCSRDTVAFNVLSRARAASSSTFCALTTSSG
jgi:hypothetical protein